MNCKMCTVHSVSYWLLVVGGLNWGLVGALNLNVVDMLLGGVPVLVSIVYVLVGLSAVAALFRTGCKSCKM